MNNIPVYQATINDEYDGITAISLVSEGAVEVDFLKFKKEKGYQTYAIQDEEQHLLLGCIMRADFNIYRVSPSGEEYFIRYDRKTIEKMATKMLKDDAFSQIDIQHDGQMLPKGVVEMRECFIKDTAKGISPIGFDNCADGSLFAIFKVNDEGIWQACKQGLLNSFSLEGYFDVERSNNFTKTENKLRNTMNKVKEMLKKMLMQFGTAKAEDGTELNWEGDKLDVDVEVTDADGNPIPDGDYVIEKTTYTIKDGKVSEVKEEEKEDEKSDDSKKEEEPKDEEKVDAADEEPAAPVAEPQPEKSGSTENTDVEALKGEVDALKAEVEAIKKQLSDFVNQPAAEPVAQEFHKVNSESVLNKKYSRAKAIASALKG